METGVWSVAADEAEAASVAVNARLEIAIVAAESAVPEANEGSVATKVATAEITTATKEAAFKRKLIRTHSHAVGRPITPPKPRKPLGVWPPPVCVFADPVPHGPDKATCALSRSRSEEHTSELQSLMRISNAVFCFKKKKH